MDNRIVVYVPVKQTGKNNEKKIFEWGFIIIIISFFILIFIPKKEDTAIGQQYSASQQPIISNLDTYSQQRNWVMSDLNNYPLYTVKQSSVVRGRRVGNMRIPPQDVIDSAFLYTNTREQAYFLLSLCYHERGIKNWYDDFLCGYGATDTVWISKYKGWKNQLRFAARHKVNKYFKNRRVNLVTTLGFAKHSYGTTDWEHYSTVWYKYFPTIRRALGD